MQGGLYTQLVKKKWLLSHKEVTCEIDLQVPESIIIFPQQIPVITYPYEWSFDMWKDAALLTLNIAKDAVAAGMMLKDATPFNIQFLNGKPVFIDTLSFEKYIEEKPWIAYRQFCECFLAPVLLQQYCNSEAGKMLTIYPDGIPLKILISLLPKKAKWNLHTYLHIYLQANMKDEKTRSSVQAAHKFSKQKMLVLLNGLIDYVKARSQKKTKTTWDNYYSTTILSDVYLKEKTVLVESFLNKIQFTSIVDLGANDGHFSLLFKNTATQIVAVDSDENCINELYSNIKKNKITNILPVINTLNNPSPAIGWNNTERSTFYERIKGDVAFALALIHHLAIARNVPLKFIASWLATICKYLLIEFVPKTDEKVQLLLQNREDIFDDYTLVNFEQVFAEKFEIICQQTIHGTERELYLMKRYD